MTTIDFEVTYCSSIGRCPRHRQCVRCDPPEHDYLLWLDYWRLYGAQCPMFLEPRDLPGIVQSRGKARNTAT